MDLTGAATIRQTQAVLGRCRLMVSNNTGPLHLAAAMGVSTVDICCHTAGGDPLSNYSPSRFGAWGAATEVLQPAVATPPCTDSCSAETSHCIQGISVDDVFDAAARLLSR